MDKVFLYWRQQRVAQLERYAQICAWRLTWPGAYNPRHERKP